MEFISDHQGSQKKSVDAIDLHSKDSCDNKARVLAALARCHQDLVKTILILYFIAQSATNTLTHFLSLQHRTGTHGPVSLSL